MNFAPLLALCIINVLNIPWSFAVIGDTQNRPRILKKAIKDMRTRNVKFAVHLGDLYWCGGEWGWKSRKKIINRSNIKWYYALGNHELYRCEYFSVTRKKWCNFFYGDNEGTFRTFTYKGKRFIILDTAMHHMPIGHLSILKHYLSKQTEGSVFLFGHRPLPIKRRRLITYKGKNSNRLRRHWYRDMVPMHWCRKNRRFVDVIKKSSSKILAYFHGHYHAFRKYFLYGIRMYSSGGGGGKLETKHDYYHYLIVTVYKNTFKVKVVPL